MKLEKNIYTITEEIITSSKSGKEITFIVISVSVGGENLEIGRLLKTEDVEKKLNLQLKFGA